MIAMDREDRDGNVDVLVFIVDVIKFAVRSLVFAAKETKCTHPSNASVLSLRISNSQGFGPRQFSLSEAMTWYMAFREGSALI